MYYIKEGILRFANSDIEEIRKVLQENSANKSMRIVISKAMTLDTEIIKFLCNNFSVSNFIISDKNESELYNEEETPLFIKNVNIMRVVYNKDMVFEHGYSVEQGLEASRKMNDWVSTIKNARLEGKELSVFEKYLCAYRYASFFEYKFGGKYDCRELIPVLTGDKIVCVGFAKILAELCRNLDIPCTTQDVMFTNEDKTIDYHMNCSVMLKDEKYGIDGVYYADPCWDCLDSQFKETSLIFALMKYSDIQKIYKDSIYIQTSDFSLRQEICYSDYRRVTKLDSKIQKGLEREVMEVLENKRDFYLYISEDILWDFLSEVEDNKNVVKIPLDIKDEKDIQSLCDEMFRDIVIYDFSREQTDKDLKSLVNRLSIKNGYSNNEIFEMFIKTAKSHKPSFENMREYMFLKQDFKDRLIKKNEMVHSEINKIDGHYRISKEFATTIAESTLYRGLKNSAMGMGLSKKEAEDYANESIDYSIYYAHLMEAMDGKEVDNFIIRKSNEMKESLKTETREENKNI